MAELHELIEKIENPELRAQIAEAAKRALKHKQFGLVFEEHLPECTPLYDIPVRKGLKVSVRNGKANEIYTVLKIEDGVATCLSKNSKEAVQFDVADLVTTAELGDPIYPCLQPLGEVCNAPDSDLWHTLIEADNYHALQLLEYLYAGKVDCIYIDPPYNTRAKDWKYNNDYVDPSDSYRHSMWLSMMQKRLEIARRLLNPKDSVMIVTIDEKEYLHLGCLLEEMFPDANMQMVSSVISFKGSARKRQFTRLDEYIFILEFGDAAVQRLPLSDEWRINPDDMRATHLTWKYLIRSGNAGLREKSPGNFYPVFFTQDGKYHSIGDALPADMDRHEIIVPEGTFPVFPIDTQGREHYWNIGPEKFLDYKEKGYIKFGKPTKNGVPITFLTSGEIKKVEQGVYEIDGYDENGAIISKNEVRDIMPGTQWRITTHDATRHGTDLLTKILPGRQFPYPKSLYAVHDVINFFVAKKPDALIVDFFAGSGTTLHAVNLLNSEDDSNRRCIVVTNNEVSYEEANSLRARGLKENDPEWLELGIARHITWPRTVCTIEGHDVNGNPIKGNYYSMCEREMPMADGFKTNAVFFKLGFLDKTKVSLGMQFKELLSTLWMKAGAIGKCPVIDASVPDMLILPENKMAVLTDENRFCEFAEQLAHHPEIKVVYLVTDYESSFVAMTQTLDGKQTYQLYRDYLDNFRINAGRNSR